LVSAAVWSIARPTAILNVVGVYVVGCGVAFGAAVVVPALCAVAPALHPDRMKDTRTTMASMTGMKTVLFLNIFSSIFIFFITL
jgi:hypothetical protein